MQTIIVTGGYGPGVIIVDPAGLDLTAATLKLTLVVEDGTYPTASSSAWQVATPANDGGLRLTVTALTTPGHYHVWLQITVAGATVPVRVLDVDGRPFLVHVI